MACAPCSHSHSNADTVLFLTLCTIGLIQGLLIVRLRIVNIGQAMKEVALLGVSTNPSPSARIIEVVCPGPLCIDYIASRGIRSDSRVLVDQFV